LLDEGTFWLSNTPEVPSMHWGNRYIRICSWARLRDTSTGQTLYFYNTHLDNISQVAREKGARLVAEHIHSREHDDPFILTGDFNAGETNPAISYLKGETSTISKCPVPMRDSYRVIDPDSKIVGTFNGFKGTKDKDKIDYVFVSEEWEVKDAAINRFAVDGHTPSDHFPVTARLALPAAVLP
jgi:endonuclease/exonuclease/phosphatase family metal-dependent hydrolase